MSFAIFRLGQRYISRRLLQSVLFVVGVALGVAMVIAIDIANTSSSRAFDLSAQSISGKATHQILGWAKWHSHRFVSPTTPRSGFGCCRANYRAVCTRRECR